MKGQHETLWAIVNSPGSQLTLEERSDLNEEPSTVILAFRPRRHDADAVIIADVFAKKTRAHAEAGDRHMPASAEISSLSARSQAMLAGRFSVEPPRQLDGPARLIAAIVERFAMLAAHPKVGRLRPEFGPEVRAFPVESHVVSYREEEDLGTGGRIAGPLCLPALETARAHVVASTEEGSEQRNLGLRRRLLTDVVRSRIHRIHRMSPASVEVTPTQVRSRADHVPRPGPRADKCQLTRGVANIATRSYIGNMASTGIRNLKDKLSHYVRRIEAGERIAVTAHGRVVAELVPPAKKSRGGHRSRFDELVAEGVIRPATTSGPLPAWPDIQVPPGTVAQLIDSDRGEA